MFCARGAEPPARLTQSLSLPLSLPEPDDDDPEDDDEDPEEEEEEEPEELDEPEELEDDDSRPPRAAAAAAAAACCCAMMRFGAFFKWLRRSSVRPPRPMAVKKLMAKRVLRGLSLGNMPAKIWPMRLRGRKARDGRVGRRLAPGRDGSAAGESLS